jgi:hypothetical protein
MKPVFALFTTFPATGFVHVETFPTAFDRALVMIQLASEPVTLRTVDYPGHVPHRPASRAASAMTDLGQS